MILPELIQPIQRNASGKRPRNHYHINGTYLTEREMEVLRLMAAGLHNKEMAGELSISIKTVEKHRYSLNQKLRVDGAIAAIRFALRSGLLDLESFLASRIGEDAGHGEIVVSGHRAHPTSPPPWLVS